ncbi:sensor histidine kinase [Mediterranea massiliensis]|uniref:sensor histidine kinase n=1 Tax=Mediterranea massiliensis TaxID=1841865 RepID=UPI0025A3B107|nr:ATP-binding protein [Mediterranea massiliensis]MDM8338766.1 ATP-binding protein [Mediterranea massiliensis]
MRIKYYSFILALLLVGLAVMLVCFYSGGNSLHLYLMEGVIAFLLIFWLIFNRKIVKPLELIGNGMDLLREQDFSSRLTQVGQFEADRVVNIFNRMMDQLKNERLRLREQNHFLDLLIQASPMGVVIVDFDGRITQVNPMAVKMFGLPAEQLHGCKLAEVQAALAKELARMKRDETAVVRLNDSNIYKCTCTTFTDSGFPHPFYLMERMTDELMRAEKKAYEKVIRMIAHEVNNTTAGITSALDSAWQVLSEEQGMDDLCGMMRVCMERCYSMSRFITRFADVVKIPEPVLAPVDLNVLATSCARFMESVCKERNIGLRLECDPEAGLVKADVSLMEQVLVNILKNAVESIGSDGEIIVRTAAKAFIEIVDNGPGISKEVESKLFSPFFSTKPNGQGIGLVFIREVLSRHRCSFSLSTYEDGLTRFRIRFNQ